MMSERCLEEAAFCVCSRFEGHDGAHECTADDCGGMWTGDIDDPRTFRIVAMPGLGVQQ